jgi:phosphatidylserine/phosphatidylglycerophosphate/cardiolipin synthase-like enzyme
MKSVVVDGRILHAGSTNWTQGGFTRVAETNLEIHGGRAPAQAAAMFERDWATRSVAAEPPSALALQLCKLYQRLGPNAAEPAPEAP